MQYPIMMSIPGVYESMIYAQLETHYRKSEFDDLRHKLWTLKESNSRDYNIYSNFIDNHGDQEVA